MLNAVLHGKAGRVRLDGDSKPVSWRQLYKKREDILTAEFFSRFTYLSGLVQHQLLRSWFDGQGDFSEFEGVEYWPNYELGEKSTQNNVEPDLLLRFSDCDVLIEVKPPEGGNQSYTQWRKEIDGYFNSSESKALYFLAVGRIGNVLSEFDANKKEVNKKLKKVNAIEWKKIAVKLYQLKVDGKFDAQDLRIVNDMIQALKLYGIRAHDLKWKDLSDSYSEYPLSLSVLNAWSK